MRQSNTQTANAGLEEKSGTGYTVAAATAGFPVCVGDVELSLRSL